MRSRIKVAVINRVANRISRVGVVAALTIAVLVGVGLVDAGTASAQCVGYWGGTTGVADPYTGQPLALETAVPGTCNYDGTYTATLSAAPGWTPAIWVQLGDPGNPFNPWAPAWTQWYGTPIVSWSGFSDQAREFLCAVNNSNGSAWCGIGGSAVFLQRYDSRLLNLETLASAGPPYLVNVGF
jgi:hypothetical protein